MLDAAAALNGLATLVKTVPGIEDVTIGAPESPLTRVYAWVMVGESRNPPEQPASSRRTGLFEDNFALLASVGYVVEGAEADAEIKVSQFKSEFIRRIIYNRTNPVTGTYNGAPVTVQPYLDGSVERMSEPTVAEGTAGYVTMAGVEVRVYPFAVIVKQTEHLGPV